MPLEETLRRLPPGAVDFARELFDQHWSEAGWLYGRREVLELQGKLLSSDQWLDIEARADAHVVALQRGGRLVLDECERRTKVGDCGELHTAIRILCRGNHLGAFQAASARLDWRDPARAAAVADALAWDAPEPWHERVGAMLAHEGTPEHALGPLATVAALRGWALGDVLVRVLERRVGDLAATADAVARLDAGKAFGAAAMPFLSQLATADQEPRVRCAAATAALQLDPRAVVAYLGQLVATEPWAAVPLALAAGPEAFGVLAAALERSPQRSEILLGLGLLGHVDAVPLLVNALATEADAGTAAEALYLVTGAELHEEAHVVDDPADPDAEPGIGLLVMRLSRSRARWTAWIDEHGPWSSPGGPTQRLRLGLPFDPLRVLDELGRTSVRRELREAMATELSIRYRLPRGYSSRMPVATQRRALSRLRSTLQLRDQGRPPPGVGAWVVDGRVVPNHVVGHGVGHGMGPVGRAR
jgi:hypothetical protein